MNYWKKCILFFFFLVVVVNIIVIIGFYIFIGCVIYKLFKESKGNDCFCFRSRVFLFVVEI